MKYQIKDISGIQTIFTPMKDINSVTVEIMCKAGSIYEIRKTNGISHFLEHLFFKGGKKYPTPKAVAEAVDKFGGEFNAYTTNEYAGYYVKCAPEFIHEALDVLGDMMLHACFPKDELEREKWVVIQEIKMYEDTPMALVLQKRQEYYFGDNSYGWPTIWTMENVLSFNQAKLHKHKNELYTKDNLIINVAGKIIHPAKVQKQISALFGKLPAKKKVAKPKFRKHIPAKKIDFFNKKTEQIHLVISTPGFKGNDDRKYAANVLTTILGGNMSSRLFQNIREKQWLCYYIKAQHLIMEDAGVFIIRAGIDKQRFDEGVKKIFEELDKIAQGDITQEEFDNAIGYNEGQIQMGIETSDEMANFLGTQYLIYKKIETLPQILKKYKKLKIKDIIAIAKMMKKENCFLYYIK